MLQKTFLNQLKKDYKNSVEQRRMIISTSNAILHDSKRTIFAIHKPDLETAKSSLENIENRIKKLQKNFGYNRLIEEGAYQAAVEEYVEAKTFYWTTKKQNIKKIIKIKLSTTAYLGGISDLTGELLRQAINAAAQNNLELVKNNHKIINDILNHLVNFDMTGYLRTKYDQAKNNLRKIEQINYEINLKK
ncbi:MAG: hypothetical protein ABIG10_00980 [bacterium]